MEENMVQDWAHPNAMDPGDDDIIIETPWPNEEPLTVPEVWPDPVEEPVPDRDREKEPVLTWYKRGTPGETPHAYAEELYGWKVLLAKEIYINQEKEGDPGTRVVLESPAHRAIWPVGEPLRAENFDPSAQVRNMAGIHTVDEGHWDELYSYLEDHKNSVLVKCQLFGKTVRGTKGVYRSQGAMPVLVVGKDKKLLLNIANTYGVDTHYVGETSNPPEWESDGWQLRKPSREEYQGFQFDRKSPWLAEDYFELVDPQGNVRSTPKINRDKDGNLLVNKSLLMPGDPDAAAVIQKYIQDYGDKVRMPHEKYLKMHEQLDRKNEGRGYRDRVKLKNNTILHRDPSSSDQAAHVQLHNTNVISFHPHHFELDTGGWPTVTTKDRINSFIPRRWGVFSNRDGWWVYDREMNQTYQFKNGMAIDYEHGPINQDPHEVPLKTRGPNAGAPSRDFWWHKPEEGWQPATPAVKVNPDQMRMFESSMVYDWAREAEWKIAMPVTRPKYVDTYLEGLAPNELHESPQRTGQLHCVNPKCTHEFTSDELAYTNSDGFLNCPMCGFSNLIEDPYNATRPFMKAEPGQGQLGKPYQFNPGGRTRSGLTLKEMGDIGEEIVLRMAEIPGIGPIQSASDDYQYAVDAIIDGQKGKFGVEIKTNHSQAQERFKIGGKVERQAKITYCLTHGLKPALIGVRLNFFTDKAYIFFREGLTDTWVGNNRMIHVGTFDFSDLNPFKSPDPQAQAQAVNNANLPDQSEEEEFAAIFGKQSDWNEEEHPRSESGKFVAKKDQHEIKVLSTKGKHTHTIKRCSHCGVTYQKAVEHKGRFECPTCGEDPERTLKPVSRIILGAIGENELAKRLGWQFVRYSSNGKPMYAWQDANGYTHIVVGYGDHGKTNKELAHTQTSKRMANCMEGICSHATSEPGEVETSSEPGSVLIKAGQKVLHGGRAQFVHEIEGDLALVYDIETGAENIIPVRDLQAVARAVGPWTLEAS